MANPTARDGGHAHHDDRASCQEGAQDHHGHDHAHSDARPLDTTTMIMSTAMAGPVPMRATGPRRFPSRLPRPRRAAAPATCG